MCVQYVHSFLSAIAKFSESAFLFHVFIFVDRTTLVLLYMFEVNYSRMICDCSVGIGKSVQYVNKVLSKTMKSISNWLC